MALGITRSRLRGDTCRLFPVRSAVTTLEPRTSWLEERGPALLEGQGELSGGFPGYAESGAALTSAHICLTASYLTVDEGMSQGFAIPVAMIAGVGLMPFADRDDPTLVFRYVDTGGERSFRVRFRSGRVGSRGGRRALRAIGILDAAGVRVLPDAEEPGAQFAIRWDDANELETENVLWAGVATVPVIVGRELAPSDVWLTSTSVIWASNAGDGINRIPHSGLLDVVSTRLRDRVGTPAIYLAVTCEPFGRLEIPFVFDRESTPDRNFRERDLFHDGLDTSGIEPGATTPVRQPWRPEPPAVRGIEAEVAEIAENADGIDLDGYEDAFAGEHHTLGDLPQYYQVWPPVDQDEPAVVINLESLAALEQSESNVKDNIAVETADRIDDTELATSPPIETPVAVATWTPDDIVLAVWSAPVPESVEELELEPQDLALSERWAGEPTPADALVPISPPLAAEPWAVIRRFESSALNCLDELFRAIDLRVANRNPIVLAQAPPSSFEQSRALAELAELQQRGFVDDVTARKRSERLVALGDICVRLKTLVELHETGYLTNDELGLKRKKLVDGLSISLVRM